MNNVLATINFLDKFSMKKQDGKLESWAESVKRIYDTHRLHLQKLGVLTSQVAKILDQAEQFEIEKKFLSSQRMRQWAIAESGRGVLKHNSRMYNCATSSVDRLRWFAEGVYLMLSGTGIGALGYREYIDQLPDFVKTDSKLAPVTVVVQDSIEGWADALLEILVHKTTTGAIVNVDTSLLRPEGALIDGRFKAPDPMVLQNNLESIVSLIEKRAAKKSVKFRGIDALDITCFAGQAVLSAGVRRAAISWLYDIEDKLVHTCKDGEWYKENPQRALVNISAAYIKGELTVEDMAAFFGAENATERGMVVVDSKKVGYNPCFEIGMYPFTEDGESGWSFCNLVEIPSYAINNDADGKNGHASYVVALATFMATVQATYDSFPYLGKATEEIVKRDALIGVSITGLDQCNLSNSQLERLAELVKHYNFTAANNLGINRAKRTTTVKPGGNSSVLLGVTAGISDPKGRKVLRRITVNKQSPLVDFFTMYAPNMICKMKGSDVDYSIMVPLDAIPDDVVLEADRDPVEYINRIAEVQTHWVETGTALEAMESWEPKISHNVSNTVRFNLNDPGQVKDVSKAIVENQEKFSGLSFLDSSAEYHYPYLPYTIADGGEVIAEYVGNDPFYDSQENGMDVKDLNMTIYENIKSFMSESPIFSDGYTFEDVLLGFYKNYEIEEQEAGATAAIACSGGKCEI